MRTVGSFVGRRDGSLLRWIRAHQLGGMGLGLLALGVFNAVFGAHALTFPFVRVSGTSSPMRHELPAAFAALVVGGMNSRMQTFEETATAVVRRWEVRQLVVASLMALMVVGGTETAASGLGSGVVAARSFALWEGLALISGAVFKRQLAWIVPLASIFPITYMYQDDFGRPYWWVWTHQSATYIPSWVLMLSSLAVGLAATFTTSWHWRRALLRVRG